MLTLSLHTVPFERIALPRPTARTRGARTFARRFFGLKSFLGLRYWISRAPQPESVLIQEFQGAGFSESEAEGRQILAALTGELLAVDFFFGPSRLELVRIVGEAGDEPLYSLRFIDENGGAFY